MLAPTRRAPGPGPEGGCVVVAFEEMIRLTRAVNHAAHPLRLLRASGETNSPSVTMPRGPGRRPLHGPGGVGIIGEVTRARAGHPAAIQIEPREE